MYKIDDLIIYGRTGVCVVEDISEMVQKGEREGKLYYTLRPFYQNCNICTPVDSKVFIRPVLEREQVEKLIASLPELEYEPYYNRNINQLREHYKARIESFDCRELAGLCISVYRKKQEMEAQKKKLGAVDERFLKEAEELLFGEIGAVLGIERAEVREYIDKALKNRQY